MVPLIFVDFRCFFPECPRFFPAFKTCSRLWAKNTGFLTYTRTVYAKHQPRNQILRSGIRNLGPELPNLRFSFLEIYRKFVEISRKFLEFSRNFLEISRNFLEISRNFLEFSRNFLEISKKFLEISRNFLELSLGISQKFLRIS